MLSNHQQWEPRWRPTPTGQALPAALPESSLETDFAHIVAARRRLQGILPVTPLVTHPRLNTLMGAEVHVKLENTQPVGAFKIRGGLNLLLTATPRERALGYVTATRGNHGQSIAYACSRFASPCVIFVPRGNDRAKNRSMRALGADLREAGDNFDQAWAAAQRYADDQGARLVHPGKEEKLVAGVGTWALELLEQVDQPLDAVFVPVGVGSVIAGTATAIKALSPHTQVIGVQSAAAPAMTLAWRGEDPPLEAPAPSLADGLAVGQAVPETLAVMTRLVDDMVLVSEEEIARAMRWYASTLGQLAEGAGAAALAGAFNLRPRFRGGRIAVLLSGGNIELRRLRGVLSSTHEGSAPSP